MTIHPGPRTRADRWWSAVRVVMLGLLLVTSLADWWSAPRRAGYDEAWTAVSGKSLVAYQWGDSWESQSFHDWFDDPVLRSGDNRGPIFAWRTGDGRVRWTDAEETGEATNLNPFDEYSGPGSAALGRELTVAGLDDRSGAVDDRQWWRTAAGVTLGLIVLGVLIGGPAPVLGTRWFWFWLTLFTPYSLGVVFWMFRDRPWSRTVRPAAGGKGRDRGWFGLVTGILAAILISVILSVLRGLLGERWVP